MKKNKFLILAIMVLLGVTGLHSLSAQSGVSFSRPIPYADPFLAGVLSWTMPGAGQMYAKSWTKGSFFVMGEVVNKSTLVFLLMYLNDQYGPKGVGRVSVNWNGLAMMDKVYLSGYLLLSSAFRVYNALDAVQTAKKFNRDSSAGEEPQSTGFVPGLAPNGAGGFLLSAAWNRTF